MNVLIDSNLIGIVYLLAAGAKALDRQWEHVLTRLFIAIVYLSIGLLNPDLLLARLYSRYSVFLLAVIELISYVVIRWLKWIHHK